jgi:ligand-binding sensor domain-containing protein
MTSLLQLLNKKYLYFILFFFCFSVSAQNVKNYTMTDGLPGNSIKCLFKDSKGLLWIATETGLCTYDGSEFKIIGREQGLKYNSVWGITEDDKKNIWLSVYGNGIAKYDGKKFSYFSTKDGLINNSVRTVFFSKKHQCLVFGTEDGLSVFNGKKFKNFNFKTKNYSKKFQVNFISSYQNDIVFNVSYENIYKLKIDKNQIDKSTIIQFKNPNTQNYSGLIHKDNYYGRNLLSQFEIQNLKTNQKVNFGKCSNIWDLTVGENNSIYSACWEGNSPNGAILRYENGVLTDLSKKLNLPTSQFWDLLYDKKAKQLWAGSIDQGVFVIDLDKKVQNEKINFGIYKPEINALYLDEMQNLWIGGNNFILRKDKNNKTTHLSSEGIIKYIRNKYQNKNNTAELVRLVKLIENQKTIVFQTIKGGNKGNIWALTNVGLFCFNQNLDIIQHLYKHETTGAFDFISSNKLFLSHAYTYSYVVPINKTNELKEVYYRGKIVRLDANKIFKTKNKLWIASWSKGLYLYENDKLISINDLGGFVENNVIDIIEDKNQNLIIGTVNGKVYFSKWNNQKLIHSKILNPDKDIIGNTIFFIRKYEDYFFIGTNKGINIIKNYKLYKFINQDEKLPQTTYTDACVDSYNSKLLVSTYKGIISLDMAKILKPEKLNSPINVNQIKVNGDVVLNSNQLNLSYNENTIEIQFGSNNIYSSKKNYYKYKIVGLTNKWSDLSTENSLKLFNLKSGKYLFIVEGKNIGTNENFEPLTFTITVLPPFWETWWFLGLLATFLIIVLIIYIRIKITQIKNKAKIDKRIAETKLQALQSQMNPHFVFNAMNSIQNFVIDNQTDEALKYIGEFSKLIRQTLEFSSKQSVMLSDEIEYLERYISLENLRRNKKVEFVISTNFDVVTHTIEIPPLLIQPIVENVFIHAFDSQSKDPKIEIEFNCKNDEIICRIIDNGKGFMKDSDTKQSKGIKLVDERIRLITGADEKMIQILSNPAGGTIIILTIPLR